MYNTGRSQLFKLPAGHNHKNTELVVNYRGDDNNKTYYESV